MSKQCKLTGFFAPKQKSETNESDGVNSNVKKLCFDNDACPTTIATTSCLDQPTATVAIPFADRTIAGATVVVCPNKTAAAAATSRTTSTASSSRESDRCYVAHSASEFECKGHFNDVSNFVSRTLNDDERSLLLNNPWMPPKNYVFPLIEKYKDKKLKLRFQRQWLDNYEWLLYSENDQGAYCKYCVAFAQTGAVGSQPLGHFVKTKFDNWKHATECLRQHNTCKYHTESVSKALDLKKYQNNSSQSIINQIDKDREKQINKNRQNLKPIIEAVILCGCQEIALRGHRDSGKIEIDNPDEPSCSNEGNFRAILKYRAVGDTALREILEGPGERNKYVSPTIQNEIIESCNQVILNKIVKNVNEAKCFTVLSDETTDISTTEQVAICVRYINQNNEIKEDFLQFFEAESLKGRDLAETIIKGLNSCGVDCEYMIGQGYDGAGSMAGKFNGVQAAVREKYPKAIYLHCAAHSLNLAITKASEVQSVRNCLGTVEKMYVFFNTPKRKSVLMDAVDSSSDTPQACSLKRLSATRWISKYDAINDFIELLPFVHEALDTICSWNDSTSADAKILINAMDFEFFVALFVTSEIFGYGLPLCKLYQKESLDLKECILSAECTIQELNDLRQNSKERFEEIYLKAKSTGSSLGVEEGTKRVTSKQRNRCNVVTSTVEDYYRVSIFNPYIDYFIHQLKERFTNHEQVFNAFMCLFETSDSERQLFETLTEFYAPYVEPNSYPELRLWKSRMAKENLSFKSAYQAFLKCDNVVFPNVHKLLQILCTLPVSTATPERMFSALKRIKTYLRNTIGQSRLNGLASLAVHKNIPLSAEEVLDELAKKKRRILLK